LFLKVLAEPTFIADFDIDDKATPSGITFKPDDTKMYITVRTNYNLMSTIPDYGANFSLNCKI